MIEHADYGALVGTLKQAADAAGKFEIQHIDFNNDSTVALTSPATEFVTFKVKPDSEEKLVSAFKNLSGGLTTAVASRGAVYGASREHKGTFVALIGWDSFEVCCVVGLQKD